MTLHMDEDVAEGVLLSRFPTTHQKRTAQSTKKEWKCNTQIVVESKLLLITYGISAI